MNQYEAADEIIQIIPEAKDEIIKTAQVQNAYAVIKVFTKHIKLLVERNNQLMIDRSLRLMDKIHGKGDQLLKNAVENVFVFSWDSVISSCNVIQRKLMAGKMPIGLYTVYIQQVYKSGL